MSGNIIRLAFAVISSLMLSLSCQAADPAPAADATAATTEPAAAESHPATGKDAAHAETPTTPHDETPHAETPHGEAGHPAEQSAGGHGGEAHTGESHGADHGGDHGGGHHVYTIWGDLSLWSAVAFIGFCWAIKKLGLWDLMVTTMAEREKAAWAKLDAADAMLTQAEASLRKFRGQFEALDDTVRAALAEGERDVTYTRSEIVRLADQEAHKAAGRATAEIERARDQALHAIFESLADQVVGATEKALKQRLDSGAQDRLIETTLNRLAP